MHIDNAYVRPEDAGDRELVFRKDESHYLTRILRKKPGDTVFAVDGLGKTYEARMVRIQKAAVSAEILRVVENAGEPSIRVTLAQGIVRSSRFGWLVEKATELGAARIVPMHTARSVRMAPPSKIVRWQKIALAAMKQCGRSVCPGIEEGLDFNTVVDTAPDYDLCLIAHAGNGGEPDPSRLWSAAPVGTVLCMVGPEGGFEEKEVHDAVAKGFIPLSLGPRRLRSETAGIVLLARVFANVDRPS